MWSVLQVVDSAGGKATESLMTANTLLTYLSSDAISRRHGECAVVTVVILTRSHQSYKIQVETATVQFKATPRAANFLHCCWLKWMPVQETLQTHSWRVTGCLNHPHIGGTLVKHSTYSTYFLSVHCPPLDDRQMSHSPGRLTLNRRKISVKKAMISGVLLETWGSLDDNDDAGEICNEDDDDGGSDSNDDESGLLFGEWQWRSRWAHWWCIGTRR